MQQIKFRKNEMVMTDVVLKIQKFLKNIGIDAFIVPHEDEFLAEYVPKNDERLYSVTNFTGSAGFAIIKQDNAHIFVDGRYQIQVKKEVDTNIFSIHNSSDIKISEFISNNFLSGSIIALDPRFHSRDFVTKLKNNLEDLGIIIKSSDIKIIDENWDNRPIANEKDAYVLNELVAELSTGDKLSILQKYFSEKNLDIYVFSSPENINWILNIRGFDIPQSQIVNGFGFYTVAENYFYFYTNMVNIPKEVEKKYDNNVIFKDISKFYLDLSCVYDKKIACDFSLCNSKIVDTLELAENQVFNIEDISMIMKARKNQSELKGMKNAALKDGVAFVKFLKWFNSTADKTLLNEISVADKLRSFRDEDDNYIEDSFSYISGFGSNSSICHYNAVETGGESFGNNGVYLIDSGGQYSCGTTDITRCYGIGNVENKIKSYYNAVVGGHIALASLIFPAGTFGYSIESFARQYLWQIKADYDHGTGHGVGCLLSVHEGPQSLSKRPKEVKLEAGMVVSIEPGYYEENLFGLRFENLYIIKEVENLGFSDKKFLKFENITFVPIDISLLDISKLTPTEKQWINNYHQLVYNELHLLLDEDLKVELKELTKFIV